LREANSATVFNISAMRFSALSANAIRTLNKGAAMGGFAHDTGGFSPCHAESSETAGCGPFRISREKISVSENWRQSATKASCEIPMAKEG
jgi:glutamate synthase domain-containing protein 2